MSTKRSNLLSACLCANVLILFSFVSASTHTDPLDVTTLENMYGLFQEKSSLTGWMATGGDPCGQKWAGISCSGSSVSSIKISGLGLGGKLSSQLSSLHSLTHLDMSSNNISGEIPSALPINLIYLNMSKNHLFGVVANTFTDLRNLKILDLSFNNFSGDLPSTFGSLQNLQSLYLQHNQFTGSVEVLAKLDLSHLNIESNNFSGYILGSRGKKFELTPTFYRQFHNPNPMAVALVGVFTLMIFYAMMVPNTPPPPPPPPPPLFQGRASVRASRQRSQLSAASSPPPIGLAAPPREPKFKQVAQIMGISLAVIAIAVTVLAYTSPQLPTASYFRSVCNTCGHFILLLDIIVQPFWLIYLYLKKDIRLDSKFVMWCLLISISLLVLGVVFMAILTIASDVADL